MISHEALRRQAKDFEECLTRCNWTNEEATALNRQYGEVVSVRAVRAMPYGVTVKFATKTQTFGPMLLTPVVVTQLLQLLNQEGTQHLSM